MELNIIKHDVALKDLAGQLKELNATNITYIDVNNAG